MIIFLHVLSAVASLAVGTIAFVRPTSARFTALCTTILLTVISGVVVALTSSVHMAHFCATGLLYVLGMAYLSYATQRKLARVHIRSND